MWKTSLYAKHVHALPLPWDLLIFERRAPSPFFLSGDLLSCRQWMLNDDRLLLLHLRCKHDCRCGAFLCAGLVHDAERMPVRRRQKKEFLCRAQKQGPKAGRKSRAQTQDVKAGRTLVQSFTIIPVLSVTYSYTTMCSCSLLSFILTSLDLHSKSYHTLYVLR
jgi:hypothetical protein